MAYENPMMYNDPYNGHNGSFTQMVPFHWQRKALIDIKRYMYFTQLSDTINMPKHWGKTIKMFHYIPLLDDRNINDQGIDATGASTADEVTITITDPDGMSRYAVGTGATEVEALTNAQNKATDLFKNLGIFDTDYATTKASLEGAGWTLTEGEAVNGSGNLYGSSRDIGTIASKLPVISETGGRVNRVGFKRETLEAQIVDFGFFREFTEDMADMDNDPMLLERISYESTRGANEIYEDTLAIDLLNNANVVYYGGTATSMDTVTGETSATQKSELTYSTLVRLDTILNNNRCPRDTKIIAGSKMTDTRTIGAARYAFIGPELKMTLLKMKDFHNNPAFIPVHQYADAGNVANNEIGAIGNFRFIVNPHMPTWQGQGAEVSDNAGYFESNGHYDVFPMLVVGSGCFTTIGFQSGDANSSKFKMYYKKPGMATADRNDPYGKFGFHSVQWWYGILVQRPEWLACVKVVAPR